MHKGMILILSLLVVGLLLPVGFSNDSNVVITYGETTNVNPQYKSIVDDYFKNTVGIDISSVNTKIITASQVNQISSSITGKYYNSNQIFSSALVDIGGNEGVKVDTSKITTITPEMYASALESSGITQGTVYVTSPVTASGESALAGIMNSYEAATDVEIPESVKQAANNEIFTQAEIVNNSDVSADELADLVNEVKKEALDDNITSHDNIVNLINNYVQNNNIEISNNDIENLASSIEQVQNVQGDVDNYKEQINNFFNENNGEFSFDNIINWIKSFFNYI